MLGRNGGISLDQPGRDAAHRLDGQRKRRNIQQKDIAGTGFTGQLAALHGSTQGHTLIRIQILTGFLAGQLTDLILDSRYTGGTAYQQNLSQL